MMSGTSTQRLPRAERPDVSFRHRIPPFAAFDVRNAAGVLDAFGLWRGVNHGSSFAVLTRVLLLRHGPTVLPKRRNAPGSRVVLIGGDPRADPLERRGQLAVAGPAAVGQVLRLTVGFVPVQVHHIQPALGAAQNAPPRPIDCALRPVAFRPIRQIGARWHHALDNSLACARNRAALLRRRLPGSARAAATPCLVVKKTENSRYAPPRIAAYSPMPHCV